MIPPQRKDRMERRIPSRQAARVAVDVDRRVVVVVGLVASGLGVALPEEVAGGSRSSYWFTAAAGAVLFVGLLVLHGLAQPSAVGRRRGEGVTLQLLPFGGVPKIVIGAGMVAFVAGAYAEGLLTFLAGWMLLDKDRSRADDGPMTVAEVMTRDAVVVSGWRIGVSGAGP